jgi:glycosyltransferase A (GT-A) superfamily protein (DUF2064 family)
MQGENVDHAQPISTWSAEQELHLVVFTKPPIAGLTKQRLSREIGSTLATRISAALVENTLATAYDWLQGLDLQAGGTGAVHLYYTPVESEQAKAECVERWLDDSVRYRYPAFRIAPQKASKVQSTGDQKQDPLGSRLIQAFTEVTSLVDESRDAHVVVIGSDCPALDTAVLQQAFAALHAGHGAVIGPAQDGGYYLLGLAFAAAERTRWARVIYAAFGPHLVFSQNDVCARTVEALRNDGVRTICLPVTLNDVDTAQDLVHLPASMRPREWFSSANARLHKTSDLVETAPAPGSTTCDEEVDADKLDPSVQNVCSRKV